MKKKYLFIFLALLVIFIFYSLLTASYSPERLVDKIGISNSYFTLWLMALIGGTSIFLPFPYYIFTISLGAAGLNPFLLGLCAGLGTMMGDTTSYFLAYSGRKAVSGKLPKFLQKIFDWSVRKKPWRFMVFAFVYSSIAPLPDDLIVVPAGFLKYPFWRIIISVGLGKVVFNTILAFAGLYGWYLLSG